MRSPTPYAVAARSLLRDTLFDAAREQLRTRPWSQVTMAEVAKAAGLSRQTMYNEFGSRDAFAQAFVMREAELFLASVEDAIVARADNPPGALRAALEVFLRAADEDPFVRAIVAGGEGADDLLALVTTQGRPVVDFATERMAGALVSIWRGVPSEDAHVLAENVVRLAISHAALPSLPAHETAATVASLFEPYIAQVLGQSARAS